MLLSVKIFPIDLKWKKKKTWTRYSDFLFDRIIIKLTADQDRRKISELEFHPHLSIYFGVNSP